MNKFVSDGNENERSVCLKVKEVVTHSQKTSLYLS